MTEIILKGDGEERASVQVGERELLLQLAEILKEDELFSKEEHRALLLSLKAGGEI